MSPAPARSTTPSSSRPSIATGTKAGSAANTNRRPRPRPGLAGPQNTCARRSVRTEHEESWLGLMGGTRDVGEPCPPRQSEQGSETGETDARDIRIATLKAELR